MEQNKLLQIARDGAAKYNAEQFEVLKRMVNTDSGSRDAEGVNKVAAIVEEVLSTLPGIQIEKFVTEEYGTNLVARITPPDPTGKIVINSHLDTVYQKGDCEKFPFRIEGDTMYGLGIVDCKGGFVVSAYAVKIMQEAGLLPNKEIVMIYSCDEEICSPSSRPVFEKVASDAEMAFIFESSREDNGALTSRKGSYGIELQVTGRKSHAGVNYLAGASATMELAHKMMALRDRNIPERNIFFNVADLQSTKPNNIVPDFASAKIGVRVSNQEEIDIVKNILAEVEADTLIEGTTSKFTIYNFSYPMDRTPGNVKLYELVKMAAAITGQEKFPEQASGGSGDAGWFSFKGIP